MRKITCLLILLTLVSLLCSQTNKLENYQVISFNGVTRFSFTFSKRPITNVIKEANSLKLTVHIPNCDFSGIMANFQTPDVFAKEIAIVKQFRDLKIEISTQQAFELVRQSGSQAGKYTVHIDILKTNSPHTLSDILALTDYYNYTGNSERLDDLLKSAQNAFPNNNQINERLNKKFPKPKIYIPQPARTQTAQVKTQAPTPKPAPKTPEAPKPVTVTKQTETPRASTTPTASTQTQVQLPMVERPKDNNTGEVSYTLITRLDRFPTRIPKTKLLLEADKDSAQIPDLPSPPQASPETVETVVKLIEAAPVQEVITTVKTITDTVGLDETEKLLLSLYNIAKVDSNSVALMLGTNALIVGDYENSLKFLKQIPEYDSNFEYAIQLLHKNYIALGDKKNANFYASLMNSDESSPDDYNFFNTPVKLWMTFIVAFLTLAFGIAVAYFYSHLKKDKDTITEDDLTIHKEHLIRAYQNKEMYNNNDDETAEEDDDNNDNNKTPQFNNEKSIADSYDDPPILTENLQEEEEQELIEDEKSVLSFGDLDNQNGKESLNNSFDEDFEMDSFGDDEYKKKMVLKLYNDGWDMEEIAKELQMSQREIDFIIKMNQ